ncbi:GTPase Era [Cardinium endosymbiont of Culicoides punctatus]|uniref:GTPase Era n=1 Tax=Cardinium endosymbiont of Culicoides punctatus TaxID=2304601 RepID=UPI0010587BE2|nr:GTPase Era [Cardinium endosymbiont of Culicoides punctatus]TDG94925.1 GTPase Era [Cardinium endosymbiont of Culicoides punctatus]
MHKEDYKSGFVAIIGKPNAGKSTLMNKLVGEKLAITNSKAQTTRHKISGIVSEKNFQIVYIDTPGILDPAYPLQTAMMEVVKNARLDADIIVCLADVKNLIDSDLFNKIRGNKPAILVLNKIDLVTPAQLSTMISYWSQRNPDVEVIPISAIQEVNIAQLLNRIVALLPTHPAYYPEDMLTDKPERFFVQEIIREKILDQYRAEIPYSVEVVVESFNEMENLIKIRAIMHVERSTQKGILIGHKGEALKKLGTNARQDLERFFQKKIFLEQHIKVTPNWRKNELLLAKFGYQSLKK